MSTDCESLSVDVVGDVVPEAERVTGSACILGYDGQIVYSLADAPHDAVPWLRLELRGEGRLRRRVWIDEDGGEWPASPSYYDSELGVACQPRSWTAERCIPAGTSTSDEPAPLFADERCTEPAWSRSEPVCVFSPYVWRGICARAAGTISPPASAPPDLYRFGEPLSGPLYARDESTGECTPRPLDEGAMAYRLEPADLDELALVRRVLE